MRMQDILKEGGCEMHNCKPDCKCEHDSHDESGSWWKDENGNGVSERATMHADAMKEDATAGGTSAGSIASVASVPGAKRKVSKKGKYGAPKAPQATNADGTAKNAQDMNTNLMGGGAARR